MIYCDFSPFSGLIRATNNYGNRALLNSIGRVNNRIEMDNRQLSLNSITSETVEEEKLHRDNSATEKQSNRAITVPAYSFMSKSPSLASNSITVSLCHHIAFALILMHSLIITGNEYWRCYGYQRWNKYKQQ